MSEGVDGQMSDELEKKFKLQTIVNGEFIEQIAELSLEVEALGLEFQNSPPNNHLKGQIAEIKEDIRLEVDMRKTNTKTLNQFLNDWANKIKLNKEVLRELIAVYEQENLVETGLLEKLDSPKKTEKKESLNDNINPNAFMLHGEFVSHLKDSGGEKIPIDPELMERIMSHKSVPMDKSKLREKLPEQKSSFRIRAYDDWSKEKLPEPKTEPEKEVIGILLDSEFESGRFLERQKLIEEFYQKLNVLLTNDPDIVFDQIEILIEEYKEKLKK